LLNRKSWALFVCGEEDLKGREVISAAALQAASLAALRDLFAVVVRTSDQLA
jgi:hypothetical protein